MSVVTANDIERANGVLTIGLKDVVTPLAADRAKELGVRIERVQKPPQPQPVTKSTPMAASTAKPGRPTQSPLSRTRPTRRCQARFIGAAPPFLRRFSSIGRVRPRRPIRGHAPPWSARVMSAR